LTRYNLNLTPYEKSLLEGSAGEACALSMRIICGMAEVLGAERLVEISSAHIDGCLYHGPSGVDFAERLVAGGGCVRVPSSTNVGALDLIHPGNVRLESETRELAKRLMNAYVALGCKPTWTCAPYDAGYRPKLGEHIAWAESNAVVFANTVLGARTERYGDFMDICAAIAGRAPYSGLHVDANRCATLVIDTSGLSDRLKEEESFYPALGAWLGRATQEHVPVIVGLPATVAEGALKAMGASAASTGAVGLFHVVGRTPEAATLEIALGGKPAGDFIALTVGAVREARDGLSSSNASDIDAIALGSPHFSLADVERFEQLRNGRKLRIPVYVCTGRHVLDALRPRSLDRVLEEAGVALVVDTCVVVTPVIPGGSGVLMTNSGKFAHYARPNIGFEVVFGSLAECVETAVAGKLVRDEKAWS